MLSHSPPNYRCPLCLANDGIENEHTLIKQHDRIYEGENCIGYINSFYVKNNPGHVIVVPKKHFENIYDIPTHVLEEIHIVSQQIAIAMKISYACTGITLLQNNEPDGGQHAFHYHLHIFPRYANDKLHSHMANKLILPIDQRRTYADRLKTKLNKQI
jgi:histidine triad (HIT) family protein